MYMHIYTYPDSGGYQGDGGYNLPHIPRFPADSNKCTGGRRISHKDHDEECVYVNATHVKPGKKACRIKLLIKGGNMQSYDQKRLGETREQQ